MAIAPSASFAFWVRAGEVVASLRDGGEHVGAVDEEVGEGPRVACQLCEQAVGRDQRRAQVLVGLVRLGSLARVDGGRPLDDVSERLALRAPQRVEELVEVDRRGGSTSVIIESFFSSGLLLGPGWIET